MTASGAQGDAENASTAGVVLGRYRILDGPPLGTGGWCIVQRAEDKLTGQKVAVKTYNEQATRELGDEALAARLEREVRTFERLGVGPEASAAGGRPDPRKLRKANPRQWLVNLLDFSRDGKTGRPGQAEDGKYYTVLELADESLGSWLQRKASSSDFVSLEELREVGNAVARGLVWLHRNRLCHLDVKPENIMRFGSNWKLIDLEGCLESGGDVPLSSNNFTPLYASPELAQFALGELQDLRPEYSMDMWAAGVVLLDVLAHASALQETKAGFDSASLFDEEAVPFEGWYRWLADPAPLSPSEIVTEPASSLELLKTSAELRDLLGCLLDKDPAKRLPAPQLAGHPLLVAGLGGRSRVEEAFERAKRCSGKGSLTKKEAATLFTALGLRSFEADILMCACGALQKGYASFEEILDFLYPDEL